jgi:hypothetical protein
LPTSSGPFFETICRAAILAKASTIPQFVITASGHFFLCGLPEKLEIVLRHLYANLTRPFLCGTNGKFKLKGSHIV